MDKLYHRQTRESVAAGWYCKPCIRPTPRSARSPTPFRLRILPALAAAEDRGVEVQIVVDTRHSRAKASRVAMK
jgi:hypothetical protein